MKGPGLGLSSVLVQGGILIYFMNMIHLPLLVFLFLLSLLLC